MANKSMPVTLALGVGTFSNDPSKIPGQLEIIQVAREHNIKLLDTARSYNQGESEVFLGSNGVLSSFDIITKASMGMGGTSDRQGIVNDWNKSQDALKTTRVAYYLLHHPDDSITISETMEGVQELYLAGKFEKFGLSNFSAKEVEECYDYAKSKDYVLPTAYQSIYGLAARRNETQLFPTLRRLGISIQAYSSLASGFLVKTPDDIKNGVGNFKHTTVLGKILQEMYGKPSYLNFLNEYAELAKQSGNTQAGLAYRWVAWDSALKGELGDAVVLGASSAKQLKQTAEEIEKGPLDKWVVERLEELWKNIEKDAPEDNFGTYKKLGAAGAFEGMNPQRATE